MSPEEFERHVHSECLRILRYLVKRRYDNASERVAALALLAEERNQEQNLTVSLPPEDPYDLKLLRPFDSEDDERER